MQKMTLKAYAQKHKQSIFNVMKMAKSGQLQTVSEIEDGKETLYILEDETKAPPNVQKDLPEQTTTAMMEKHIYDLRDQIQILREDIQRLQMEIHELKKG